ncbi:MAG: hypothetical protein WA058_02170 [Minisyncoccia bacterium]
MLLQSAIDECACPVTNKENQVDRKSISIFETPEGDGITSAIKSAVRNDGAGGDTMVNSAKTLAGATT